MPISSADCLVGWMSVFSARVAHRRSDHARQLKAAGRTPPAGPRITRGRRWQFVFGHRAGSRRASPSPRRQLRAAARLGTAVPQRTAPLPATLLMACATTYAACVSDVLPRGGLCGWRPGARVVVVLALLERREREGASLSQWNNDSWVVSISSLPFPSDNKTNPARSIRIHVRNRFCRIHLIPSAICTRGGRTGRSKRPCRMNGGERLLARVAKFFWHDAAWWKIQETRGQSILRSHHHGETVRSSCTSDVATRRGGRWQRSARGASGSPRSF